MNPTFDRKIGWVRKVIGGNRGIIMRAGEIGWGNEIFKKRRIRYGSKRRECIKTTTCYKEVEKVNYVTNVEFVEQFFHYDFHFQNSVFTLT